MRPRTVVAAAAVVLTGVAGVAVFSSTRSPSFADLRQRTPQRVPGTLSMSLEPAGDARPSLSPDQAINAASLPPGQGATITLARVTDTLEAIDTSPAWVLIARGLCFRDAKGELVSDARGNDPNGLACTDAWFQLIAIDAATGKTLLSAGGYDATLRWAPDIGLS